MKSWSKILAGALCFALAACNNDDIVKNEDDVENGVYMQFKVELPIATRSETNTPGDEDYGTSTGGTEEGTKDENDVTQGVLVILTTPDNKFIASKWSQGSDGTEGVAASTYTVQLTETALRGQAGQKVLVYAFCNPTQDLKDKAEKFNKGELLTVGNATYSLSAPTNMDICTNGKFLMSNATQASTVLPESFSGHKTKENAIDLGTVKVERAVARFDYKQGPAKEDDGDAATATYNVVKNDEGKTLIQVQLTHIAMINMSKEFYYLRRVCKANTDGNADFSNVTLCGVETAQNYVVDTDFSAKSTYSGDDDLTSHFFYSLGRFENGNWLLNRTEWVWKKLSDLTKEADPGNWTNAPSGIDKTGYRVWQYGTENTIPVQLRQKNGISTGIVFKGKILATDENISLKQAMSAGEDIYMFNNALYTIGELEKLPEGTAVQNAYKEVMAEVGGGVPTDAQWTSKGFTIYSPNNGEYEVLYYYWNQHNNNLDPAKMGPMEFGVVRNNVYKLCVDKISLLGHPTDPGKDPDPVDPDDPDEDSEVYFKVSVNVLPWVVRVNNIVFD